MHAPDERPGLAARALPARRAAGGGAPAGPGGARSGDPRCASGSTTWTARATSCSAEHPPAAIAAAVRERACVRRGRHAPGRLRGWTPLAAAAVVTASLVGLVVSEPRAGAPPARPDVTRVKGIAPLPAAVPQGGRRRRAPAAGRAWRATHDVVQLAYQAGARRYGVIVSVDGRGVVTRHLPVARRAGGAARAGQPGAAAAVVRARRRARLRALRARDRGRAVRGRARWRRAVRRQHASLGRSANERRLDLPESMDQFSLVLRKEPSR